MAEKQAINETEWDYLIVLDACRYDEFEKMYDQFVEGELEKRISPGGGTAEWLYKTFTSRYNYDYISANPFINSYGIPLNQSFKGFEHDWNPTEKFRTIIDSWDEDWDEEVDTVRPEDLTDRALQHESSRSTIIHYIQPHRPYISCPEEGKVWNARERITGTEEKTTKREIIDKTRGLWNPIFKMFPDSIKWKIKDLFNVEQDHFGKLVREIGAEKTREYYRKDLKLALKEVKRFAEENQDKKIIITADHGELLGENGDWGHELGSDARGLREVPWLELE